MKKHSAIIITSYGIPVIFLIVALISGWGLTSLSLITILLITTAYLRARGILGNGAPGKFNTLANYTIGATISIAVIIVDIYLMNYQSINRQLFVSLYAAIITTGLIFTVAFFITDRHKHIPGKYYQKASNITILILSIIFLISILITSLIVDFNYTW